MTTTEPETIVEAPEVGIAAPVLPEPAVVPAEAVGGFGDDKEGWEPLDSGRCRFWIDGRPYTFRKPSFRELEDFHVAATQLSEDAPTEMTPLEQTRWYWDALLGLMRTAFQQFAEKPLPESKDALPAWIGNAGLPAKLIQHWQAIPLASGKS
jgi:hypothetical protein